MDEKEFFYFVEETKGIVLSAVKKYLSYHFTDSIDDVVQETYCRIYTGMKKKKFSDEKKRNNWIYTIAKNESLRMQRRLRSTAFHVTQLEAIRENILESTFTEPDTLLMEFREVLASMPERYRPLFELLSDGLSESEIAERLNLKRGTVKSRIHRGKIIISRILQSRGLEYDEK